MFKTQADASSELKGRMLVLEQANAELSSNATKCNCGHSKHNEGRAMVQGREQLKKLEQELFDCSQNVQLKKAVLESQRQQLEAGKVTLEHRRAEFQQVVAGISAAKQERASIMNEIPKRLGINMRTIDDIEARLRFLESEQFKCNVLKPWSGPKKTFAEAKEKLDRAMDKAHKLDDLFACCRAGGSSAPASLGQLHSELKAAHDKARILDNLYASYAPFYGAAGDTGAHVRKALEETRNRARVLAKVCAMIGSKCTHENVHVHVQALLDRGCMAEHSEKYTSAGAKRAKPEPGQTSKAVAPGVSVESETVQKLRELLRSRNEELATLRVESSSAMAVTAYVEGHEVLRRLVDGFRARHLSHRFKICEKQPQPQQPVLEVMRVLEDVMSRLLEVRCHFKAIAGDCNEREIAEAWMRDPSTCKLLWSVLVEKETGQVVCPLRLAQICHATGAEITVGDTGIGVQRIILDGREMSEAMFERRGAYDSKLQRAWAEIKMDVRAEVPALYDMLHTLPAAKDRLASAGQHAQVAVFSQELERLRSDAKQ